MSEWNADRELEVACRVGCLTNFERALEEGGDVDADGGSPLFIAIMNHHRHIVEALVQRDANVSCFLTKTALKKLKTTEQKINALMEGAPPPVEEDLEEPPDAED
tara:strand:- start:28597 stop:28911 length:315 start_codon:yes stop_codon:yes gene_type:complete